MNNLETASFSRNISQQERAMIDSKLSALLPYLEQIKAQSQMLAQETQRLTHPEQYAILNDIVQYNKKLLPSNDTFLHNVIQAETTLATNLVQTDQKVGKKNGMEKVENVSDIDKKLDRTRLTYIEKLEQMNFVPISTIKKVDRTAMGSFNKVWIWVLEVFYGVPSSKYFWDDFARKALSKHHDSGDELRRKMIVYDPSKLSPMQAKELDNIITSDIPLMNDKISPNPELRNFFDILTLFNGMYKIAIQKIQNVQRKDPTVVAEVRVVEEERNAIIASQRLNAVKFDLFSDVQNMFLLIDSEFK